ncbi:MAG: carbohydrate ABC transporter permease [Chloroflexi bacterium]|nr:carbohydrate ABC transporter permease [Chloroflexota bacterium]
MNVEAAEQSPAYTDLSVPLKAVTYLVLVIGAVVMVMPFAWMASTACKPPAELSTLPIRWIPQNPSCIENLQQLYETSPNFSRYMLNSAVLTIGRTLGQLVTCSLAAYGFARYSFPGRNVIFALCLGLLMVPFQAILIPEYLLLRQFGWLNSFTALIVPGTFSAFAMFLLRQAFLQIPLELEESAMIDGANPLQILRHITLPLSGPALAAFAVITVQAAWNDFLFPLVAANTPDTRVVTIGISLLQGERNTPWNLLMIGSFLATVPMLALFVMLQRYFIEGVAMSGIKG